jgi:hypothetical protein
VLKSGWNSIERTLSLNTSRSANLACPLTSTPVQPTQNKTPESLIRSLHWNESTSAQSWLGSRPHWTQSPKVIFQMEVSAFTENKWSQKQLTGRFPLHYAQKVQILSSTTTKKPVWRTFTTQRVCSELAIRCRRHSRGRWENIRRPHWKKKDTDKPFKELDLLKNMKKPWPRNLSWVTFTLVWLVKRSRKRPII